MDQQKIQQIRDRQKQDAQTQTNEFRTQKQASRLINTVKDSNSRVIGSFNTGSLAIVKTAQQTNKTLGQVNAELNSSLKEVSRQISQMAQSLKSLTPIPNDDTQVITAIKALEKAVIKLPKQIDIPEQEKVEEVKVSNQIDYSKQFDTILSALKAIDIQPSVKVDAPKIDLSGIAKSIEGLQKTVVNSPAPTVNIDMQEVVTGLRKVVSTVAGLKFPIPNYVLPFKDIDGKAAQVQLDASGNLPISASIATISYQSFNDTTTDVNLVYLGKAVAGTLATDAAWQIKRYNKSAGTMTFADDITTFTKQWSARAGYGY